MIDPDFPRYEIPKTTIDGQRHEPGTEVALKVLATVEAADVTEQGATLRLRISDWGGPWAEAHNPPGPTAILPKLTPHVEAAEILGYDAIDREARLLYGSYAMSVPQFTSFEHLPEPKRAGWTRVAIDSLLRQREKAGTA